MFDPNIMTFGQKGSLYPCLNMGHLVPKTRSHSPHMKKRTLSLVNTAEAIISIRTSWKMAEKVVWIISSSILNIGHMLSKARYRS
jgi:hypothetical protein